MAQFERALSKNENFEEAAAALEALQPEAESAAAS